MLSLVHRLLMMRVRPYYLYACDLIEGSTHFRAPIQKGIDIIRALRGHTTGYAVPQLIIDTPGGGGKVPINPEYVQAIHDGIVELRNFEDRAYVYPSGNQMPEPKPELRA
jgi:lysine 2,3-aminomutase